MPNVNSQYVGIYGSTTGQTYTGNGNTFAFAPGSFSVTVDGYGNQISGGTGPNTYAIISTATSSAPSQTNGLTTGSGDSIIGISGNYTSFTQPNAANTRALVNGSYDAALFTGGSVAFVANGDINTVTAGTSGTGAFLLTGAGESVSLQGGANDAVGIQGGGLISGRGNVDTIALQVNNTFGGITVVNSFNPAVDHLSLLINTGFAPGLTDTGLTPQSYLQASQFETGSGPTQASTRVVYNPSTGQLTYTPYGSANPADAVPVALLPTGLALNGTSIFISNRYVYDAPAQNALDSLPGQWGVTDPAATPANASNFDAQDTTTGVSSPSEPGEVYNGPVSGLQYQLQYTGAHNSIFHAHVDNVFIKSGSGVDALQAFGGTNVLDGGTNSNFLVGGTGADGGTDTFFTDARTSTFVWNSIVNFHSGDHATVFGFVGGQSQYAFSPSEGATGFQGLTINMDLQGTGQVTAKVTLSGLTTADIPSLSLSTGSVGGIPFLLITHL